jgi:hypothetical protein
MLIFGTNTKTTFIAALFFACQLCRVTAAQRLHRRRTWFTLFFLWIRVRCAAVVRRRPASTMPRYRRPSAG